MKAQTQFLSSKCRRARQEFCGLLPRACWGHRVPEQLALFLLLPHVADLPRERLLWKQGLVGRHWEGFGGTVPAPVAGADSTGLHPVPADPKPELPRTSAALVTEGPLPTDL